MESIPQDYSVFDRFSFKRKPVGVKFLPTKPQGFERIKNKVALCEMFIESQKSGAFYVQKEDFICVETLVLGMEDPEPVFISGVAGGEAGLYKEVRANRRAYEFIPKLKRGSVNYVVFCPIDKLTFDPDMLIVITDNMSQTRNILRAEGFASGDPWSATGTPILACSWLYAYPMITGRINYTVTGLHLGLRAIRAPIEEGLFVISIPWTVLPTVISNLKDEKLYIEWQSADRNEHYAKFNKHCADLRKRMPNYPEFEDK